MNKLTMFVLAALAAATVAVGGLAAAPSASAAKPRPNCKALAFKMDLYHLMREQFEAVGDLYHAHYYAGMFNASADAYFDFCA